jgi:hypothetical protein
VKQSVAKGKEVKLEVHHVGGIDWDGIFDLIRKRLLDIPQKPLCKACQKLEHDKEAK